ncbi:hypothetical protein Ancab_004806 [Ancistrocladus abbreviatus]
MARSNRVIASPVEHASIGGASDSISADRNDGNLSNLEHLEQHHKEAFVKPCSRHSEAAQTLLREQVLSSVKSLAVMLMEENTWEVKRSEKGRITSGSPAL